MDIRRVCLIFDKTLRPETAGVYCHRALERFAEVEHIQPHELDRVPRSGFDLYLNIDDGLEYQLPPECRPSAFWAIDTHLDFDRCQEKAPRFDVVFAAQRDGVDLLHRVGVKSPSWLPLACDPDIHRKHDVAKRYDVAFVGNIFPGPRVELLGLIHRQYSHSFIGQCYFDEMARTYSAARIAFNRSIRNDVNMRVFEAVACGSMLMTNDLSDNGLTDLFQDGVHLATYREPEDLLDKLAFYLAREAVRERIGAAGRSEAIAKHTYAHRMETILRRAEETLSRTLVQPPAATQVGPRESPPDHANGVGKSAPQALALWKAPDLPHPGDTQSEIQNLESKMETPDPFYFGHARPEVVALVPHTARRVLDIGCGAGRLGEAIKQRQDAWVSGVEIDADASSAARQRLDHVWAGDVEQLDLEIPPSSFDAIICADVLEHIRDPGRLLTQARDWLAPGGRLIASIPNVRHHTVVSSLLEGNWTYEPAGLLDETHLNFFTRRDMIDLFDRAGFHVTEQQAVRGPGYDEWQQSGCPGEARIGRLHIADTSPEEAEEFFVYQYLMVARPRDRHEQATAPANGQSPAERRAHDVVQHEAQVAANGDKLWRNILPMFSRPAREKPRAPNATIRISFLGNFDLAWSTERYAADALECLGHAVNRIHEYDVASASDVIDQMQQFRADCLLFFKGRIGVDPRDAHAVLTPNPRRLLDLIRSSPVPAYIWYYDRVHNYDAEPSRLEWMRQVAPLCRIAFVTDGGLASTNWANWRVLRQGISRPTVTNVTCAEQNRDDVAFIGQLYGRRHNELAPLRKAYRVNVISQVFGQKLSSLIRRHRIIVGPRYPNAPGYWSDRIYVVLGHGGFFLAPEIDGMRDEGLLPGVHYAPMGDDPVQDARYWLARPEQRDAIARRGQEFVLANFTYENRARALCAAIAGG
jgi:2-polyprenyl-3-methyl-5-hydroxy-6-metoxy-1,4-benzoquinol methylase